MSNFNRENHIQVIYDGGTVKDFPAGCGDLAYDFMEMMEEEYGYYFEYKGETLPGIEEWRDNRRNVVAKF